MNADAMFPSKYIKASDIGDHKPVVKVASIEIEELGNAEEGKEKKPVLYFENREKGLVCNKTNWNTMIALYGGETDNWIGKPIRLQSMEVAFKGKMSMSVRISLQKPDSTPKDVKSTGENLEDLKEVEF